MAISIGLSGDGNKTISSVNSLANQAKTKMSDATGYAKSGLQTLLGVDPSESTEKIRGYGNQVANIAGQLPTYANNISSLGSQIEKSGTDLTNQGNGYLSVASDLLGMNMNSSSPYVQEALRLYGQYDPNNLVSFAVQDVNDSYESGIGQLQRQNARQGVAIGSGRNNALNQQLQTSLNTARAAAATKARQYGLDAQADAFGKIITNGTTTMANLGKDFVIGGSGLSGNAISAQQAAAGVMANSAQLFGSAVDIENKALNAELGYAGELTAQQNTIASALQKEGSVLDSQSARELSFVNSQLDRDAANYRALINNQPNNYTYTDLSGNKIITTKTGNVIAANKTDNGWVVSSAKK